MSKSSRTPPLRIPVYKPLRRPAEALPECLGYPGLEGRHRPHSRATDGTGVGEFTFFEANQHRPMNVKSAIRREEQKELLKNRLDQEYGRELSCVRGLASIYMEDFAEWVRDVVVINRVKVRKDWWIEACEAVCAGR